MPKRDVRGTNPFGDRPSFADLADELVNGSTAGPEIIEVVPDNALVAQDDGSFAYKRFVIASTYLITPENMTHAEWLEMGQLLQSLETAVGWAVGDWAAAAEPYTEMWGAAYSNEPSKYQRIIEETGYSYQTVADYAWISKAIPVSIRNRKLSFSHHRLVAAMKLPSGEPDTIAQADWLDQAAEYEWTLVEFKKALAAHRRAANPPILSEGFKKARKAIQSIKVVEFNVDDLINTSPAHRKALIKDLQSARRRIDELMTILKENSDG